MQTQDKIDFSWGRNRKRTSIGVYNLSMIESPIRYMLMDPSFEFVPLGFEEKIPISEILKKHPKGVEYAHILADTKKKPLLIDRNDFVYPALIRNQFLKEIMRREFENTTIVKQ